MRRGQGEPRGSWSPGGILIHPAARLREEIAYLAYYFHWSLDDVLDLPHGERSCYVGEIGRINTRLNEG